MTNKKQAFTLIELLVVITIIGLLSTLAVFALNSASMKARDAKRMSDLKMISEALEIYNMDNGEYPYSSYNGYNGYYYEDDCGSDGVLDYWIFVSDSWYYHFCGGYEFKKGDNVYLNSIPNDPIDEGFINSHSYLYDDTYAHDFNFAPCVSTYLESMEDGSFVMFWCQAGNCQRSTNLVDEYQASCYN